MDGHECTEILLSQLNAEFRIDAEYFYKINLQMQALIKSKPHVAIGDIGFVTDGIHTSIDYDVNSGINLISATSPRQNVFNLTRNAYISEVAHLANPRTALHENDVILSTVGTIGNCAVVDASMLPANSDRHVGIIRLNSTINPYVLSTFLLTKYGRNQTVRESTGNVQPNLFLYKIREIIIPTFGNEFQEIIQRSVLTAQALLNDADNTYSEAEQLLENEIGIDMSTITSGGVSVKTFAESFGNTGRLDAEYYQKKHYELIDMMHSSGTIGTLCNIYDKSFNPDANQYYQYIELANIGKSGEIDGVESILGDELPSRARRLVKTGHVVVSSIEGSLESCAIITEEFNNALCSTGFYVIDSNNYNSETLLVLLKSRTIQSLLKRGCSGTILTNITKNEFLNIPLPYVDNEIQIEVKNNVQETYALRDKSKQLLECAKQAVEMAIEQDESTAISWLEAQIAELTK
ncbi:MAG: hypothetical protein ACI4A3_11080 [Lachnospiraceae bacterium]